jgi:hypothetical protein
MSHSSHSLLSAKELQIKKSVHPLLTTQSTSCVDLTGLSCHQRQLITITSTKCCHGADSPQMLSSLHIMMAPLSTAVWWYFTIFSSDWKFLPAVFWTPFHTHSITWLKRKCMSIYTVTQLSFHSPSTIITNHISCKAFLISNKTYLFPCTEKSSRERNLPTHFLSLVNCLKMY